VSQVREVRQLDLRVPQGTQRALAARNLRVGTGDVMPFPEEAHRPAQATQRNAHVVHPFRTEAQRGRLGVKLDVGQARREKDGRGVDEASRSFEASHGAGGGHGGAETCRECGCAASVSRVTKL
jgi:hypothetical protein